MAARVIESGQRTTRAFDTCFEMGDGAAVVTALIRRSEKRPELARRLPEYICAGRLEELRHCGVKNLAAWSRELTAEMECL